MWQLKIVRIRLSEYTATEIDEVFEYEFEDLESACALIETTQNRGVGEFTYELKKKVRK